MIKNEILNSLQLVLFDFDGVFTDNTVYVSQDGVESVRCWRSDGLGLKKLQDIGIRTEIISTEVNQVVKVRAKKLKIPCRQGVKDKAIEVIELCRKLDIPPQYTMFVGNDINDISALQLVGVPVAVADAYPEVGAHVLFRTNKPGGFGAVREICDMIVDSREIDAKKV